MKKIIIFSVLSYVLSSCSLAPTYQRPSMPIPEHYKEADKQTTWVMAQPTPKSTQTMPWWTAFQDPVLNQLEARLTTQNQDIKAAFYRYEQAKSLVQVARSARFPSLQGLGNATRQQTSATIAASSNPSLYNNFLIGTDVNYELDVWGKIRNQIAQSQNLAQASAADLTAVSLSLHAELASDYLTLRSYDEAQRILNTTVAAYQKALHLTQKRHQGGASPSEDVDNAQAQFENAQTMAADMHLKRTQVEHAIAVLIGQLPSTFSLTPAPLPTLVIDVSLPIPSTLLQRRPDIVAAESRVQAANATIGVARAAFFPTFDLNSIIGFQSNTLTNILSKPSLFWSLGPTSALNLAQPMASTPLFDGGRLVGLLKQATASYAETVAYYRQTTLMAFQEVEDSLIAVKQLDKEVHSQNAASKAANKALHQAHNRYHGGIATFLDIIVTENQALQADLERVSLMARRQVASVQLIKALGGGLAPDTQKHHKYHINQSAVTENKTT